jgi:hypothetical protein
MAAVPFKMVFLVAALAEAVVPAASSSVVAVAVAAFSVQAAAASSVALPVEAHFPISQEEALAGASAAAEEV